MTEDQLKQAERFYHSAKRLAQSQDWKDVETFLKNYTDNHIPSMLLAEFNALKSSYFDGRKSIFVLFDQLATGQLLEQAQEAYSNNQQLDYETFANQETNE